MFFSVCSAVEHLAVEVDPAARTEIRSETFLQILCNQRSLHRLFGHHLNVVDTLLHIINRARSCQRCQHKVGIELPHADAEDAAHSQLFRHPKLILRNKILRRVDQHRVAESQPETQREILTNHNFAVVDRKLAINHTVRHLADGTLEFRIDSAQHRRMHPTSFGLNKHKPFQVGSRAGNPVELADGFQQFFGLMHHPAVFGNLHMRVEAKDFIAPGFVEAGHHRQHDDEHGNAERDPQKRQQRDHRKERPLGFQIFKCQKK